jgi:hypothetical protein
MPVHPAAARKRVHRAGKPFNLEFHCYLRWIFAIYRPRRDGAFPQESIQSPMPSCLFIFIAAIGLGQPNPRKGSPHVHPF